ncbi:molybdenum cofactor biosynthesis protein MoaE [Enterococcus sp. CSURQ0835]|uniref:molybdenum cofactor biosynthesis protein MoaE n=1 Tax=Enterococcus sp. CSURQ0835 TaxID=2681394 RepID=UPI00135A86AE|nr:molybdenum cofactor biosynthesis protein MoaE [Enterococcus sp. CSURQ0835]
MALIKLQKEAINVPFYYNQLKDPAYGGIVTFVGTVREWTGSLKTTQIEYTAYEDMAIRELERLAAPIEKTGARVVLVHRLGILDLMDEAVFVGVATPHRKEAFDYCEALIDQLKVNVPIWKKEIDENEVRWGGLQDAAGN